MFASCAKKVEDLRWYKRNNPKIDDYNECLYHDNYETAEQQKEEESDKKKYHKKRYEENMRAQEEGHFRGFTSLVIHVLSYSVLLPIISSSMNMK